MSVAVSHNGRWVVSGSKDQAVQFWDAKTGIAHLMLKGHERSGSSSLFDSTRWAIRRLMALHASHLS